MGWGVYWTKGGGCYTLEGKVDLSCSLSIIHSYSTFALSTFHCTLSLRSCIIFVQSYEEAFEKLKEATEIEDIDLLVSKFIEVEDKNFALFNYVNELNNDIEILQEQINLVGLKL